MSFATRQAEALMASAGTLQRMSSATSAADGAVVARTTGVVPAAADEVPDLTAMQFVAHAQMCLAVRRGKHADPSPTFPPIISFAPSPCTYWCQPMNPSCAGLLRGR